MKVIYNFAAGGTFQFKITRAANWDKSYGKIAATSGNTIVVQ